MRLLSLPVTIVRVPIELGLGAAKQAVRVAQGLVGGGEEPVAEEPRRGQRPAPRRSRVTAPRRKRSPRRSPNESSGTTAPRTSRTRATGSRTTTSATPPAREPVAERPAAAESPASAEGAPATADGALASAAGAPASADGAPAESIPAGPAHVSTEPELVAEAAEAGAEDGAGAEVAVDEPWPGYDEMQAADIEDRLVTEGPETAAAVSLYEASRKGRATVLEAASRSLTG